MPDLGFRYSQLANSGYNTSNHHSATEKSYCREWRYNVIIIHHII